jgi:hypothetical protein
MKRKNGMTKSAIVSPSHGEWFNAGKKAPASSTMIISCNKEKRSHRVSDLIFRKGPRLYTSKNTVFQITRKRYNYFATFHGCSLYFFTRTTSRSLV